MGEWQPIETAPKDGRLVLLADFDDPRKPKVVGYWDWQFNDWRVKWDMSRFEDGYDATHWAHMPKDTPHD